MQVGMSGQKSYEPMLSRFSVVPSALAARAPADQPVQDRQQVLVRAAKPYAQAVPEERLRGVRVGQVVLNRTISAAGLNDGVAAYRRQQDQFQAWHNQDSGARDSTAISAAVSSAAGGVLKSAGSVMDLRM